MKSFRQIDAPSASVTGRDVCSPASRVRAAIFIHEWQKTPKLNRAEEASASIRAHSAADSVMLGALPNWRRRLASEPPATVLTAPATEWALEDFLTGVVDYVDRLGEVHGMPEGLRLALVDAVFSKAAQYLTGGAA